jgi:hypothetical protein
MKLIFAGTPEFAAQALQAIVDAGHEVALVLSQPDRPAGRGMTLQASPVKKLALEKGIEVFQPLSLKDASGTGKNCSRGRRGDGGGGLWPDPAASGARYAALWLPQHSCFVVAPLAWCGAYSARLAGGRCGLGCLHHADGGGAGYRPGLAAGGFSRLRLTIPR